MGWPTEPGRTAPYVETEAPLALTSCNTLNPSNDRMIQVERLVRPGLKKNVSRDLNQ